MSAKLVNAVRTPCSEFEMVSAFVGAWRRLTGQSPSKESIGVLFAQNALETGNTKSLWNYNIGNVKFVPSKNPADDDNKEYMQLENVWEIINNKKVIFNPPHPATWFKSFSTLEDGVLYHIDFLKNTRFKKSWTAVESGDPELFAKLLKSQGYYTGSVDDYIRNMKYYFEKYMNNDWYEYAMKRYEETITEKIITFVPEKKEDLSPIEPEVKLTWFDQLLKLFKF